MTETRLKHDKTAAIGQLCNLKHGDAVIYNIGHDRGPLGHVMQWLSGRGGLALVQRPIGKPGNKPRPFEYIAQRTAKPMTKDDIKRAFNPRKWD